MASLLFISPVITAPNCNLVPCSKFCSSFRIGNHVVDFRVSSRPTRPSEARHLHFSQGSDSHSNYPWTDEGLVQDLRVPEHWSDPSTASESEKSEWLRVALHKWLDDEYCQEETNVDISNVAAHSFYASLVEKQTDLGEILLQMARELESISYQERFHGAFSQCRRASRVIWHHSGPPRRRRSRASPEGPGGRARFRDES